MTMDGTRTVPHRLRPIDISIAQTRSKTLKKGLAQCSGWGAWRRTLTDGLFARLEEEPVAMTRLSTLNSPLLLGFDHLERILDHVSKSSAEGYPPYNIEQIGDRGLRITLAVAGFGQEDLSVSVEDNQLLIRGSKSDDDAGRVYLHRGIAARQFQRTFVLAEGIEVASAVLDNGLLSIDLQRRVPEPEVRTIAITKVPLSGKASTRPAQAIDITPDN